MKMKAPRQRMPLLLLLLACGAFAGCNRDVDWDDPRLPDFVLVSGHNQSAAANALLPDPIVVRLLDNDRNPLAGERVYFRVVAGGGAVGRSEAVTDNAGEASVAWQIGAGPDQIMKASLTDDTAATYAVYVYANSRLTSAIGWTRDIDFYAYGRKHDHDNRILESPHFLVFSDSASDDARVIFAKMAEESLAELFRAFALESTDALSLTFADSTSKIKIFSIKDADIDQVAFRFGFILYGHDSLNFQRWGNDDFWLRREIKHETVHVMQWLFGLDARGMVSEPWPEVWFTEGIAEYISGGAFPPITNLEQWEQWYGRSDHTNPIAIHQWGDFTGPLRANGRVLPRLQPGRALPAGQPRGGPDALDVKAMFADMVNSGLVRAEPFARTFGMTVEEFEDHFPDLIVDYLRRTGTSTSLWARSTVFPYAWSDQPRRFAEY